MAFPTAKKCCCGCSLRTGVLILGYLGVIGAIIFFVQFAVLKVAGNDQPDNDDTGDRIKKEGSPGAVAFNGVLSAILLYGVYRARSTPIMIVVYIQLALSLFYLSVIFVTSVMYDDLLEIPASIIALLVSWYFLWVQYSFAQELKEQTNYPRSAA